MSTEIPGYCNLDNGTYYSPTLGRRAVLSSYDFPDKSPKKEKKWSLGNFFRRKKKVESDSSSEEEAQKKGFLKKKKKPEKRKRPSKLANAFDHVVVPSPARTQFPTYKNLEDGVLSDPTSYSYQDRLLPKIPVEITQRINQNHQIAPIISHSSSDNMMRRSRKELTKARVQARRDNALKHDSSSDDDSQRSHSSSRFRSDDSLTKYRDGSLSRRSRAARTERYMKRLSRDEENCSRLSNNRLCVDVAHQKRSPSRSPIPPRHTLTGSHSSFSGMSTIPPPGYNNSHKLKVSNSCKPAIGNNEFVNGEWNQRSVSYDGNINKSTGRQNDIFYVNDVYRHPPPPPPRDPRRMVIVNQYNENRPTSFSFERAKNHKLTKHNNHEVNTKPHYIKPHSFHWNTNGRSTSEDNLPFQPIGDVRLPPRPSSATPEPNQQRPRRHTEVAPDSYNYLTDKCPRSRKPIFIQPQDDAQKTISQKSLEFWKRKDQEEVNRQRNTSPQIFTSQTKLQTKVFLPCNASDKSSQSIVSSTSSVEKKTPPIEEGSRKSKNLEEALDELEAIYNSLRLGDEDLLERAEQRELSAAKQKLIESKSEPYPGSLGSVTDPENPNRKRRSHRRFRIVDLKNDDMAYRKLNKERYATINDPQSVVSKVSYLLATPTYNALDDCDLERKRREKKSKEPDITYDDVVYRSIKHSNNTLKVIDPQPPFGIPLGPVTPAPNSDYLHAVPEPTPAPAKRHKIPDIVKDDLAFRNLRKDENKEPALPPLNGDDFVNNNSLKPDLNYFKKKRAVRSLSANISNLIQDRRKPFVEDESSSENQSLADVADAMEIARQVLKEKEERINATRRGFLSDTEARRARLNLRSPNATLSNRRYTFLNGMNDCDNQIKIPSPKPPRGPTPDRKVRSPTKESTPIPLSPLEERILQDSEIKTSSFDDLLKELAREAKETSDRITSELNNLSDEKCSPPPKELDKQLSEIDAVSEQAKRCSEQLETAVDNIETKTEEVEAVPEPSEEVVQTDFNTVIPETVANIVVSCPEEQIKEDDKIEKVVSSDSEHDYENVVSDKENEPNLLVTDLDADRKSPFEQHKQEIVAGFQELKKSAEEQKDEDDVKEEEGETCVSNASFNWPSTHANRLTNTLGSLQWTLKSPKLVLDSAKVPNTCGDDRVFDRSRDPQPKSKEIRPWYCDPVLITIACIYGVACTHQLASMDFVVVLGLVFAVLSVIVGLIV